MTSLLGSLRVVSDPTMPDRVIVYDPAALRFDPPLVALSSEEPISSAAVRYKVMALYQPLRTSVPCRCSGWRVALARLFRRHPRRHSVPFAAVTL